MKQATNLVEFIGRTGGANHLKVLFSSMTAAQEKTMSLSHTYPQKEDNSFL